MKTNPNELIQPVIYSEQNGYSGLTKREYFAALALQGMLANPLLLEQGYLNDNSDDPIAFFEGVAMDARVASAVLIKALNKPLTEDEKPE